MPYELPKSSKVMTDKEARIQYPGALEHIELADGFPFDHTEWMLWVDRDGRLHIDDAVHPCCDDVWVPEDGEWVASDGDDEEE